jgi:TolB-like protein/Flp pilus assembly protein TadD
MNTKTCWTECLLTISWTPFGNGIWNPQTSQTANTCRFVVVYGSEEKYNSRGGSTPDLSVGSRETIAESLAKVLSWLSNKYQIVPKLGQSKMSKQFSRVYEFGAFRLDVTEGVLFHRADRLSLTQKELDTLLVLVQNPGRLVRRDELMANVWSDACVEPANLTQNIFVLRKILAQYEPNVHFIETASKRGYRFVAPVHELQADRAGLAVAKNLNRNSKGAAGIRADEFKSLAVLPFANGTADPNAEYLSDGLTESIINSVSQLQNLRVVARNTVFRYKSKEVDPQKVGSELGVCSVLTGRILQLGDRLIIRAELIDVLNGWQIWGEQYQRKLSDILVVQEEISEEISLALKRTLTGDDKKRLTKRYTENVEAYHFYLKGRYHWNKFDQRSLSKAVDYFVQAIEIDPTYALAYAGLADSYYRLSNVYAPTREAMPKAKAAAIKALEIDETLSEAHAALGLVKLFYEWDWSGAEEEFVRAIEINPNYALAHQRFGLYFNLLGRSHEAMRELELALTMDPLSPQIYWSFALTFFLARDHEQAFKEVQKTLELDGSYQPALYLLGRVHGELGQLSKAITVFENLLGLNDGPMFRAALGHAYARAGMAQEAREVINDLEDQSKQRYVSAYNKAAIQLALGDKNQAFSSLEQAYQQRCEMMTWLKVDPAFDTVRTDLRFANLLRRVGLDREDQILKKRAAS